MKTLLIIIFQLLFIKVMVLGQYLTTIHTPTNASVEALVIPEESPAILAAWESQAAKWISDHGYSNYDFRIGPASATYNCHSYAWHKSDGGNTVWMNKNDQNSQVNVAKYWTGSTYTYSTTNQLSGTKVFLETGDHSMIVAPNNSGWYQSKWGNWPLYRHTLTTHPYNMTNPQYFKINVNGSSFVCSGNQNSYNTLGILNASYDWVGEYITISGTGSSITGTGNGNGNGNLKVSILSSYSGTTICGTLPIWVGTPLILNKKVDGINYTTGLQMCPGNHVLTVTPTGGNANNAIWTIPSGITYFIGNNECNFVFPSSASNVTITCYSTNNCGTGVNTTFYLTKKPYGCSGSNVMTIYPNPASENITIKINDESLTPPADSVLNISSRTLSNYYVKTADEATYTVNIYNSQSSLLSSVTRAGKSFSVPLINMQDGTYIIEVTDGKNAFRQQFIVRRN